MVLPLILLCLLVVAGATSSDRKLHSDANRRPWGVVVNKTLDARAYRPSQQEHHHHKWREANAQHARPTPRHDGKAMHQFRSSPQDMRVLVDKQPPAIMPVSNSLSEVMKADSAGEGKDNGKKKRTEGDDDDEEKKTLSQQISDGKYGLIQKEIYPRPPLRPGIISYKNNPEIPSDTIKNLGGLDAEEIWLAEDHVLVLRGGWFPNHMNRTEGGSVWPPIDAFQAPLRQVKIPAKPQVPPPFPVQLKDGGPTHFIGPNGTKSLYPFPPPFFPFPPGDGFYPPPGNESLYPPPQFQFPPQRNDSNQTPQGNYPPQQGNYPPQQGNYPPPQGNYPPPQGNFPPPQGNYPYPPPPHGFMPFPNGTLPFGPLPPFFPPLPPGAAFLPPPGNQTEYDEDDPSIYYPPPYDFYYQQDNTTRVPPGPLVPGIILPPPPNFFAPLNEDKQRTAKRPTSTPLPHVPLSSYPPTATPKPPTQYYPSQSPRPITVPHGTPGTTIPPFYPLPPRQPTTTTYHSLTENSMVTSPPSSTPYGSILPGPRPTVKRPYLTYVPVTTEQRKKNRPTTTPKYEYEITQLPVIYQTTITQAKQRPTTTPKYEVEITRVPVVLQATVPPAKQRAPTTPRYEVDVTRVPVVLQGTVGSPKPPQPPTFVSPQHVQVFHKGESPIIARPYYYNDNGVTSTPDPNYDLDDNVITSTPRPNYITEGLSKLKDILYTTPVATPLYPVDDRRKQKNNRPVTSVETVKSIEYPTEAPLKYYSDFTRKPIYVKDFPNDYNRDPTTTTVKQQNIIINSVHPTQQPYRDAKANRVTTTPATLIDSYHPDTKPKTTYYFYDEPTYQQGYVQDVPAKQNVPYNVPKWQYDNDQTSQRPTYNMLGNLKTTEEQLLAQIADTLRQPGNGFYYNSPVKQSVSNNYYNTNVRPPVSASRPLNGYANSSPRPGFYITRKPEYYPITTPSSYSNQGNREFPYSFEDVIQSTERPPPQVYGSTQRPKYQATRLKGPDYTVQTSPKTVYEYSYQKQPDTANNYVSTVRPRVTRLPLVRQPPPVQYFRESSPGVTPVTNNQIYETTTSRPIAKYQGGQTVTPDPLDNYFTQQDDTVLDDITKKYFTIFGQKLRNGGNGGFVPITTPLPTVALHDDNTRHHGTSQQHGNYVNQPDTQADYPVVAHGDNQPTQIPLYDDIAVNYHNPRPAINPDSEYINPHRHQYDEGGVDNDDNQGGKLISYKLPGNEGAHFYFVTPQVVKQQQQQQQDGAYQYPVPSRGLRARRNKIRQR